MKAKFLFRKINVRTIPIILLIGLLITAFIAAVFWYNYTGFLSSIPNKLEYGFCKALYQRDITYIEKYFDNNTVIECGNKTIKFDEARKNIIAALNNSDIIYPEDGTYIGRYNRKKLFRNEKYYLYSYIVNPYQETEVGFYINVEVTGYKKFVITKVEISEPFWKYFFYGEGAVNENVAAQDEK